jgi:cell division protease FtsH
VTHDAQSTAGGSTHEATRPTERSSEPPAEDRSRAPSPPPRRPALDDPRKRNSILLVYTLVALAIVFAWNVVQSTRNPFVPIAYSEFKKIVREGGIKEAEVVGDEEVRAELKEAREVTVLDDPPRPEKTTHVSAVLVKGDTGLAEELEKSGAVVKGNKGTAGTFPASWVFVHVLLPMLLVMAFFLFFLRRLSPQRQVMSFGKSKARVYAERETRVTFDDVAGIDEAKDELREVIQFLREPEPFRRLGARIPKGILLVGSPGTGKTLLARAVAGEANVPFFSLSGSDFVEMFAGVGASRVRDLFEQAAKHEPCIIFIDELDALGKVRGIAISGADNEREQTLNQLLSEMDGFGANTGVVILAATNRPEILDPALLRPGRFDRQVVVDKPDVRGRLAILKVHAKRVKLAQDVDLEKIARATPGFVGADLEAIVNEAALLAGRKHAENVGMVELREAIERAIAGLEKKSRLMSPREKERTAHHESGHALVGISVENADPVHRISIIPRGVAALGYTLSLPAEDRYNLTRSQLEDRLAVLLGGRAAELLVYGEVSTGDADDLQKVVSLARRMVRDFGMSERFGPVAFGGEQRPRFLEGAPEPEGRAPYSEDTARAIDDEVEKLVKRQDERVRAIIATREQALRAIAKRLVEVEVIEQEELLKIARENGAPPVNGVLAPETPSLNKNGEAADAPARVSDSR